MKLKARDLIPGWPRGRSTVVGWNVDGLAMFGFLGWYPRDEHSRTQAWLEIAESRAYHAGQQAMVDGYRNQWSGKAEVTPHPCWPKSNATWLMSTG